MIIAFTGAGISKASGIATFDEQPNIRDYLTRTYARIHPMEYNKVVSRMEENCLKASPNDAHIALAEYEIPIITMNVDGLHERAGSKVVLPIHGSFDNLVLYGDPAPKYQVAMDWITQMQPGDRLLIIGTSYYTVISEQIRDLAISRGAQIIEINSDAEHKVREVLENLGKNIETFEEFMNREIN